MDPFSVTEAMVSWLESLGYDAFSRVPGDMPNEFVTVEREGGRDRDLVDHALMAVQCWALTEDAAESLARAVRLALVMGETPAGIHGVTTNAGPYPFYDPETRRPRYQLVLEVACRVVS